MKKLKAVHVVWIDSATEAAWTRLEDLDKNLDVTHSVGFLIEKNEKFILLALSFDIESQSVNNYMYVPRVAVLKMETLCQITMKSS